MKFTTQAFSGIAFLNFELQFGQVIVLIVFIIFSGILITVYLDAEPAAKMILLLRSRGVSIATQRVV
ncbi:MAG: hypothetical protein ABUK01_07150 [Leptospirales bacterium]